MEHISQSLIRLRKGSEQAWTQSPTEPNFNCALCKDGGWLHLVVDGKVDCSQVKRCPCRAESDRIEIQQRLLKMCALPERTEHKTFGTFKTLGSKKLTEALKYCKGIAEKSDKLRFLTLLAQSDRGKSHLGIAICREWLSRQEAASYVNVARMLNSLREGYSLEGEESFYRRLHFYCTVGLLVLDDFGTERVTDWGAEQVQTIINSRYDDALHTVVTSNRPINDLFNYQDYPKDQWREYANMRIKSRLERESWCRVILLDIKPYTEMRSKEE